MKRFAKTALTLSLVALIGIGSTSCSSIIGDRIDPGYVGLLVDLYGADKGIDNAQLKTGGRVTYNWGQELYEYPVFYRTYTFSKEGEKDNSVNFSISGSPVSMDLGATYKFRYDAVDPKNPNITYLHQFFRLYRVNPDDFNNGTMRNALRDCANEAATGLNPVELATNTAKFVNPVKECLVGKFPQLDIKEVSLLSPARLPENIQASINRAFQSQQDAQTAIANTKKAEAEAAANKAKAEGDAAVERVNADAKAYANQKIAGSITPALIEYERLQVDRERNAKWNGQQGVTVQTPNVQLPLPADNKQ